MQKKLIALAVAAAFSAPAFADTTVYGLVDVGYGQVTNTTTPITAGAASTKTGEAGTAYSQNQTSRVGVKSVEDLSNGMKGVYQLEIGLSSNPQSDASFGKGTIGSTNNGFTPNATISPDRVLTAGLDFGQGTTVVAGKMSTPLRNIAYGNDAMWGANFVGNLVTMDANLTSRATVIAAVHNFGPVVASLAYLGDTKTADGVSDIKFGNGFEATAVFTQNALSVSGGYRDTKANNSNAYALSATTGAISPTVTVGSEVDTKDLILAANYNFGIAKLYGQYATVTADTTTVAGVASSTKLTFESMGVNVPFTPVFSGFVELSAGKNDIGTGSVNRSGYAVGAKYDMSKTTSVYADIGSAKQDVGTVTGLIGSKVDQIAVGILKSF